MTKEYQKEWRDKNKDKVALNAKRWNDSHKDDEKVKARIKRYAKGDTKLNCLYSLRYGITLEEYQQMFQLQEGRCKICKIHQLELKKRLHVDHDHETGKVRGLLCNKCNMALGLLNDDPLIIQRLLNYLNCE